MGEKDVPLFPKRYVVTCLASFGFVVMLYLRANLSIAIVQMTSPKIITKGNITYEEPADFQWDTRTKGTILGSFSYGYFFSPIGGMLATKYGGATIFGLGLMMTAVMTVLSPVLCRLHFYAFITARVLEGVFEASSMASCPQLFAQWAPPEERVRLITFATAGAFLGTTVNYPVSGIIAKYYGWQAIFYVSGFIAFTWYSLWVCIVRDSPAQDKRMSAQERTFIQKQINSTIQEREKIVYPWKAILRSRAVWTFLMHRFASSWLSAFVLICLPLYIKGLYRLDIEELGIVTGIPNLCSFISHPLGAILFDCIRSKRYFTVTTVYKIFTCISYIFQGIILIMVGMSPEYTYSIVCFSVIRVAAAAGESTSYSLPVDLAPKFAGFLAGIGTAFYSIGGVLSPNLLGYMVTNEQDPAMWNQFFLVLSGISFVAPVLFLIFASAEQQSWNEPDKQYPKESYKVKKTIEVPMEPV